MYVDGAGKKPDTVCVGASRRFKRNFVGLGETTVEGVGFPHRGRRRSGTVCEDACNTAAAFHYRTYVDGGRAKPDKY